MRGNQWETLLSSCSFSSCKTCLITCQQIGDVADGSPGQQWIKKERSWTNIIQTVSHIISLINKVCPATFLFTILSYVSMHVC